MKVFLALILMTFSSAVCAHSSDFETHIQKALKGDPNSIHKLCYNYIYGSRDVEKNYDKAFRWCSQGDLAGNIHDTVLLGEIYLRGHVGKRNPQMAFKLNEKAAKMGHPHAMYIIGLLVLHGDGVKKDLALGKQLLEYAVRLGSSPAKDVLSAL